MTTATEMLRAELIKTIQEQHLCQTEEGHVRTAYRQKYQMLVRKAVDLRQAIQFMTQSVLVAVLLCATPLAYASDLDQAEAQLKQSLAGEATVTRQDLPQFTEAQIKAIQEARRQLMEVE